MSEANPIKPTLAQFRRFQGSEPVVTEEKTEAVVQTTVEPETANIPARPNSRDPEARVGVIVEDEKPIGDTTEHVEGQPSHTTKPEGPAEPARPEVVTVTTNEPKINPADFNRMSAGMLPNTSQEKDDVTSGPKVESTTEKTSEETYSPKLNFINEADPNDGDHMHLQHILNMAFHDNISAEEAKKREAEIKLQGLGEQLNLYNQLNPKQQTSGGGNGGGGGLASLIATVTGIKAAKSIANYMGTEAQLKRSIIDTNKDLSNAKMRVELVAHRQVKKALQNVDDVYRSQKHLKSDVENFNNQLSLNSDGRSFLKQMEVAANETSGGETEVRKRIRDLNDNDPKITRLRKTEEKLIQDPYIGPEFKKIQGQYTKLQDQITQASQGVKNLEDNNVKLDGLRGIEDIVSKMEIPNTKIGSPDGPQVDKMNETMKEKFAEFAQRIREMVEKFIATIGFGRK